jgi:RNA polymerase sigma-70 factor (ECF subfamily)
MTNFEEVYSTYFPDVYRYVLSLCHSESEAEEITQETFFKALKSIASFKGDCKLYAWLCQIAKNTYFTNQKKEKRYVSDEEKEDIASDYDLEAEVLTGETIFLVQKALHYLEETYKEVLMLRIFGDLPFVRIAELFGKTESWARVTYL